GGHHVSPGQPPRLCAADPELRRVGSAVRSRLRPERGTTASPAGEPFDLARLRGLQRGPGAGRPLMPPSAVTPLTAARRPPPRLRGVGLLTGWGEGAAALPPARPFPPPALLTVPTPVPSGERFRRATRPCILAAAAVRAALRDAGLAEGALAGARTGVL